jgi:hypothetical protein
MKGNRSEPSQKSRNAVVETLDPPKGNILTLMFVRRIGFSELSVRLVVYDAQTVECNVPGLFIVRCNRR